MKRRKEGEGEVEKGEEEGENEGKSERKMYRMEQKRQSCNNNDSRDQ